MAKVITVNIQKGGVGKTTTVHEFASCLTSEGNRVLAIDLDQQCNLTRISGAKIFNNDEINGNKDMPSILGVLTGDYPFNTCIQHTENYDIAIAHRDFKDAEKIFGEWDDVYRLQLVMEEIRNDYDYIIIDTPPSLGILPSMALTAADYVVIPCEASASGIQGLGQLYERIEKVRHEKEEQIKI